MGAPWTDGPWEVGQHPAMTTGWIVRPVLFGSNAYALPRHEGGHIVLRKKADAHIIAAAPDLAEALEKLLADYVALVGAARVVAPDEIPVVMAARAALSKAKGETE